jgi:hypothetical protein
MKYKTFGFQVKPPDVIIEGEVTYVLVKGSATLWPGYAYEEIGVARAKGYDPNRGPESSPGTRSGRPSQWASSGRTRSGDSFRKSDQPRSDASDALIAQVLAYQAYSRVKGKDDGIRGGTTC